MRWFDSLVGSLVEAWSEVKAQKTRVILSLVGVVVAVTAMTTVIALGDILVQSQREVDEVYSGRTATLTLTAWNSDSSDPWAMGILGGYSPAEVAFGPEYGGDATDPTENNEAQLGLLFEEKVPQSELSTAMVTVAERYQIPYWSRVFWGELSLPFMSELYSNGTFQGRPIIEPQWGLQAPTVQAVDPSYAILYRIVPTQGRWLDVQDWQQRVTPVVINDSLWKMLGEPPIEGVPVTFALSEDPLQEARVVGVVPDRGTWDGPQMYMTFDSYMFVHPATSGPVNPEMRVWVAPDQLEQGRQDLPRALEAYLGEGWTTDIYGGESMEGQLAEITTLQYAVIGIGALVIFLGALGLLNVAVVTVKQRVREIGIRRALGASSGRIFFSVFMESVVATFVAGVVGVIAAIVIVYFLPLDQMGFMVQDHPAFPAGAAVIGALVSTSVGALSGLIPAVTATRIRPIEAIRA